jgi:hypothetical protein
MGDLTFQDATWSPELLLEVMKVFEAEWDALKGVMCSDAVRRRREGEMIFPALMGELSYVMGLQGEELPLIDLAGTRNNTRMGLQNPRKKHGVVALLGRFKNEIGEKHHLMPFPMKTDSGFEPIIWIERMIDWYREGGIDSGPVFRDKRGECARYGDLDHAFLNEVGEGAGDKS